VEFRLGEFFCGPGGIALGAKLSGSVNNEKGNKYSVKPFWATDYDKDTCDTYALNIHGSYPSEKVIHEDIRKLNIDNLSDCDGFAFGFPCNDFSIVGETKGLKGTFGPLYSYGVKYLEAHQPMWFIAENVGGLSSANEGNAFKSILQAMTDAGYTITPHLYKFENYGVPQARHRIIIVGIRNDLNVQYQVPKPTHIGKYRTSREALTVPVIAPHADNHIFTKQAKQVIERLKYISAGENAWSKNIPKHLQLNVKGARLSNIYKRLDPDKPAYTVTGSGGGGTHMYHWEEHRALTSRERARLQTFPDDFHFIGGKESVRKQIGMAVPPDGIQVIFTAILKTFAQVQYEFIQQNINSVSDLSRLKKDL
jgi:DNA (cytosine-5)-methyltransferase 1